MRAYRVSVNLKLGLIAFALLIAFASLAYTHRLVQQLGEREQFIIQLWAAAQERVADASLHVNPYVGEFERLDSLVTGASPGDLRPYRLREALDWARDMPPAGDLTLASEILLQGHFGVPAIIVDSVEGRPVAWHNVDVPPTLDGLSSADSARAMQSLLLQVDRMAQVHRPIEIELRAPSVSEEARLQQYVFYDESGLIKELRIFPYLQLVIVALFVLVGYAGFSYVRRNEQRSLWVGMAKEAAHQLGTPISSLMGWTELMRSGALEGDQQEDAIDEMDEDIRRLQRVAARFSDIGSLPKLQRQDVGRLVNETVGYIRRRVPQRGRQIELNVDLDGPLYAPANAELFGWVIENLLKNALDAIEGDKGRIEIRGRVEEALVIIDVEDTGKGIERREWKNIFRPGYSTKKRGWGLGLSLAKRIVEEYHLGQLNVLQSKPGGGTTFRIELSVAPQGDG